MTTCWLVSCTSLTYSGNDKITNKTIVSQIQKNDSIGRVEALLGVPNYTSIIGTKLLYRYQFSRRSVKNQFATAAAQTHKAYLLVIFENDKVVEVDYKLDSALSHFMDEDKNLNRKVKYEKHY